MTVVTTAAGMTAKPRTRTAGRIGTATAGGTTTGATATSGRGVPW
ncbi:MAG: hypothetical protein RIQ77_65 [Pseudomonadota bacterium]